MRRVLNVALAVGASVARAGSGARVGALGARPERPLVLYEYEACPYCRKVREALSILDLGAEVRPCPRGGERFRPEVLARGGKAQFPYLVDPNGGVAMYESDDIVAHLFERYGAGRVPALLAPGPLNDATTSLASLLRPGLGAFRRPAKAPEQPLELYSFEASPFCRIVRERLSSYEIPSRLHNVAKGSPGRDAFVARSGRMQVPYLVDPNVGVALFESADIVHHLDREYAI